MRAAVSVLGVRIVVSEIARSSVRQDRIIPLVADNGVRISAVVKSAQRPEIAIEQCVTAAHGGFNEIQAGLVIQAVVVGWFAGCPANSGEHVEAVVGPAKNEISVRGDIQQFRAGDQTRAGRAAEIELRGAVAKGVSYSVEGLGARRG